MTLHSLYLKKLVGRLVTTGLKLHGSRPYHVVCILHISTLIRLDVATCVCDPAPDLATHNNAWTQCRDAGVHGSKPFTCCMAHQEVSDLLNSGQHSPAHNGCAHDEDMVACSCSVGTVHKCSIVVITGLCIQTALKLQPCHHLKVWRTESEHVMVAPSFGASFALSRVCMHTDTCDSLIWLDSHTSLDMQCHPAHIHKQA